MPPKTKNRVGEKFITNEGYNIEIVEYFGNRQSTIRFDDGTLVYNKEYADIQKGTVKNPYHKSVYGVGYFGVGEYTARGLDGSHTKAYNAWKGIIERCHLKEKHPTYEDVSIYEEWYNYQNFAKWFENNWNSETMEGWHLDKDILIKNNRHYSPQTCCFIPQSINTMFKSSKSYRGDYPIGVSRSGKKFRAGSKVLGHLGTFDTIEKAFCAFKNAKEDHIKIIADKYKDQITERVYQALYNYTVEITD